MSPMVLPKDTDRRKPTDEALLGQMVSEMQPLVGEVVADADGDEEPARVGGGEQKEEGGDGRGNAAEEEEKHHRREEHHFEVARGLVRHLVVGEEVVVLDRVPAENEAEVPPEPVHW